MTPFITRAYNKIEKTDRGTIIKSSADSKLKKEFFYYSDIPEELRFLFPTIVDFVEIDQNYNLEMEFYPFTNLGQLLVYKTLDNEMWKRISLSIYESLNQFQNRKYFAFSQYQMQDYKDSMYIQKTEKEYYSLIQNTEYFKKLANFDFLEINDKKYKNFYLIWEEVKDYIFSMNRTEYKPMNFIHGDFCFSNILCGIDDHKNVTLKFIDPRGTFGADGCHGDIYYDLAKLKHSLDGAYEYIIYDLFDLSYAANKIVFTYKNDNRIIISEVFEANIFSKFNLNKINLIQGLIYIGMCARHYDSLERQIIMYSNGIRLLNEFLDCHNENLC